MSKIELSDAGTLIIPVLNEDISGMPAILQMGKFTFHMKTEHHMTIFNFPIGKKVNAVCRDFPSLRHDINTAAAMFDWTFPFDRGSFIYLNAGAEKNLKTIITMVNTECINRFYSTVHTLLDRAVHEEEDTAKKALDTVQVLRTLLKLPPPPHITLYTTDPEGKKGIGLNSYEEFCVALDGERPADSNTLEAYSLDPALILG